MIIGLIPGAIAPAALSYLSASLVDDAQSFRHLKLAHLRSVWTLLLVLTCPACLLLPTIIKFTFGDAYSTAYRLSWIALWLSMLTGVMAMLVQHLVVAGRTIRIAWVSTIGVGCFIGASYFLVPRYHAAGFLLAQIVGNLVSLPFVFYPALAGLMAVERKLVWNLTVATAVSVVWTFLISSISWNPITSLTLAIGTVLILSSFLFLKVLSPTERTGVRKLITLRAIYA